MVSFLVSCTQFTAQYTVTYTKNNNILLIKCKITHTHVTRNLRKGLRNFLIRGANLAARVVVDVWCAARSIADWRVPFSLTSRGAFFFFSNRLLQTINCLRGQSGAACQARRYDASSFGNTGFFTLPQSAHTHTFIMANFIRLVRSPTLISYIN